ncbi:MAG: SDR family oxidoreductase, partial [Candidatus Latescibacteria bacterium]|nr:SDR family oxidoreductase [Candidatus Latescibacterota bacterium]
MKFERLLIVGGLGYIGSAVLTLLRSRDASCGEVVVVDKRFVPERVRNFPPHWSFVQADMGDPALFHPLLTECDVCFLLAAEVEAETSHLREREIWEENYEKPRRFIEALPEHVRLLFPSSCNVFGGNVMHPEHVFIEQEVAVPKYPYAETKVAVEEYLRDEAAGRPWTIVRFGTNYGWAEGVRFNLVANLFVKQVLQGQDITLHGTGDNFRPFTHTLDCARALLHLAGLEKAQGETYHVVGGNHQIQDVATIAVQELKGASEIIHLAHTQTFASYRVS